MSERPVTLFMFAGRRQNMEINLPLICRILDENPRVRFDLWNLARDMDDAEWIAAIDDPRINVMNGYAGVGAYHRMNDVWRFYCHRRFEDHLFVKMDDDVVFIQTEKFGEFVDAIESHPGRILTPEVVNNGACTAFMPELWQQFLSLDIPLLDVHESNEYAQAAHRFMRENWRDLVSRPTDPREGMGGIVDIETWLSINFIGFNWDMLLEIQRQIGRKSPSLIADKAWPPRSRIGDEGACNLYPRAVMRGFVVAHLGFGPQKLTERQEWEWCRGYQEIAQEYLGGQISTPPSVVKVRR